jgi:hypothetical protein
MSLSHDSKIYDDVLLQASWIFKDCSNSSWQVEENRPKINAQPPSLINRADRLMRQDRLQSSADVPGTAMDRGVALNVI